MSQSRPQTWLSKEVQPTTELVGPSPIPEQFTNATLEAVPHAGLKRVVRAYGSAFWEEASRGMAPVFLGPVGTFKSHCAALLSRQIRDLAKIRTGWCTVPIDLTRLERKRYDQATDELIEHWKSVPFLVFDDFGMVKVGGWQYDVMVEIAMHRFETCRPTLWTGNVLVGVASPEALKQTMVEMMGAQLTRRVFERSEGYRIYIGSVKSG